MQKMLRTLSFALVIGLVAMASPARADSHADKLFVVVTSAEPQTQAMSFVLATQAVKRGAEVRVMLCGPGGDVALKGNPGPALKPKGFTPQKLLTGLVKMGVTTNVCALYLPNKGVGKEALIDGVSPISPPEMSSYMLQPGVRYFSF